MFKEGNKVYEIRKNEDGEITSIIEKEILKITKTKIKTDDAEYDIDGINKSSEQLPSQIPKDLEGASLK